VPPTGSCFSPAWQRWRQVTKSFPATLIICAAGLGGYVAEARLIRRSGRDYGHLLWSRWPLQDVEVVILPGGTFERRGMIKATCMAPDGPARILAIHFGVFSWQRPAQAAALVGQIETARLPTIALGDFNEWRKAGTVHRVLSRQLPLSAASATWPSARPIAWMDRIYVSDHFQITASDTPATMASDHLPLVAEVSLR
jgi:endonuclease/exonuclease/phosphatase family metal-dependent hydrolase